MNSFLVDANAFLRFLLNDVPRQKKEFEKLLQKAKKSEIILTVPQIIIFEINYSLKKYYGFPKEDIVDKLQTIIETPYLRIEDSGIFRDALKIYSEKNLSLTDCFIFVKAKEEDKKLFTFDLDLQKLQDMV